MGHCTIYVAVAAHKPYRMPEDPAYVPVHVGADLNPSVCEGYQQDNEGESISGLNGSYSELTAMYWVWQNVDADVKGLVHYRRLFGSLDPARRRVKDPFERLATTGELMRLVGDHGAVVPRMRRYYIETVRDHYAHTHDAAHLDACRSVLLGRCPEYAAAWDEHMRGTSLHICNMCVMRTDLFDAYCAWLFPILGDLTGMIDSSGMSPFEARWPGRISELLIDPWMSVNGVDFAELPVVSPEPVDWVAKGRGFLAAKFLGKKYEKSF